MRIEAMHRVQALADAVIRGFDMTDKTRADLGKEG